MENLNLIQDELEEGEEQLQNKQTESIIVNIFNKNY